MNVSFGIVATISSMSEKSGCRVKQTAKTGKMSVMKKIRRAKSAVPEEADKTKAELARAQQATLDAKRQLQLAVDGVELGSWKADRARGVYDADARAKNLHGLASDAPLDDIDMLAAVHPDDRGRLGQLFSGALSNREPFSSEYRVLLADGSLRWVASRASIVAGNILHGIVFDITHRKHAEELLSTQHQLALMLTEARGLEETLQICLGAAIAATGMNRGGIYLREEETGALRLAYHAGLSPAFVKAVELYPADTPHTELVMRGVSLYALYRDLQVPVASAELQEGLQSIAVIPIRSVQGIIGCVNLTSPVVKTLRREERSTVETMVSMVGYFILRARTEEVLRESEKKYRQLYEMESDALLLLDRETYRILDANEAVVRLYGYDREELLNMRIPDLSAEPDKTLGAIKHGIVDVPIRWHRKKDGTVFPVETTGAYFLLGGKSVHLAAIRDKTERVKLEEALRDSESQYRRLFEAGSDAMILFEKETCRIMDANTKAQAVYGYDQNELLAMTYLDMSAEPEESRTAIQAGISRVPLRLHRKKDGTVFPVEITATHFKIGRRPVVLSAFRDITERKKIEEELAKHREQLEELIKERTAELESKTQVLQEFNAALKVLSRQRDEDRKELEERFVSNIKKLILPYSEKLKATRLDERQTSYLAIMDSHFKEIISPLLRNMQQFNLTPTEAQVASLIKDGKSTKEIAEILMVATGSINTHRKSIRKKLGLNKIKVNLQLHLQSFGK